jgi:hypothetical protein
VFHFCAASCGPPDAPPSSRHRNPRSSTGRNTHISEFICGSFSKHVLIVMQDGRISEFHNACHNTDCRKIDYCCSLSSYSATDSISRKTGSCYDILPRLFSTVQSLDDILCAIAKAEGDPDTPDFPLVTTPPRVLLIIKILSRIQFSFLLVRGHIHIPSHCSLLSTFIVAETHMSAIFVTAFSFAMSNCCVKLSSEPS